MRRWIVPHLILPLHDRLSGRRLWAERQRLDKLQWRSADELTVRSLDRLGRLLHHSAANVPHYRDLLAQAGLRPADVRAVDDLARLPATGKADLRNGFPGRVVAANLPPARRQRRTTAGSTGQPLEFYADRAAEDLWLAGYFFFLSWFNTGIWDTRVTVASERYGSTNNAVPSRPMALVRRLLLGERSIRFAGLELTADDFVASLVPLKGQRYFMRGFASYLSRLAALIVDRGLELPTYPLVVINHAETLTALDSALIRQAFRCPIANQYSTWEVPQIAQTCPDNPMALHVNSERVIARVVRDDGSPAAVGEAGRLLLTDLANEVMPLINFDIGDRAVAGPTCRCGRGLPVIESIEGRSREQIHSPDGRIFSTAALTLFLDSHFPVLPYVREFQAVQPSLDELTLRIVPTAQFNSAVGAELERQLAEYVGGGVRVSVQTVERIELEPSGKRLLIKSLLVSDRSAVIP